MIIIILSAACLAFLLWAVTARRQLRATTAFLTDTQVRLWEAQAEVRALTDLLNSERARHKRGALRRGPCPDCGEETYIRRDGTVNRHYHSEAYCARRKAIDAAIDALPADGATA